MNIKDLTVGRKILCIKWSGQYFTAGKVYSICINDGELGVFSNKNGFFTVDNKTIFNSQNYDEHANFKLIPLTKLEKALR